MNKLLSIAATAVRELLYERVFYILLAFAVVGVVFSNALGELTYADQAKLSLDFMLAGTQMSLVLFSIFVGVGLFQRELTSGSVAMILSKPLSRATFLLGKFLGQMTVQALVVVALCLLTIFMWSLGQGMSANLVWSIIQAFYLCYLESVVLAAVTYALATFSGSMTTGACALSFFFLGHYRKTFDLTLTGGSVWGIAEKLLPNLELFNVKTLATYAFLVPPVEVFWLTVYAAVCATLFLLMGIVIFRERDIPT
ncbi:MAG: ABC transporter permease subunit [Deltaproteobacteria bacterium]|nr:ABC transporter permease subunit [Deltaproteobacteria bacterium]MBI3295045.1 ABC transporter permease subunit [Deltaproteobacteria bacterium]